MGAVDCRFLESSDNLKPLVQKRFGREPSTSVAREIAACLQQGRLFYEAAGSSPLEIRPLQLFYGMMGFARALITASRSQSLSTLQQTHGLKDISPGNSRISDLRVRITDEGTFHSFNDVVADLTRVCYIDNLTRNRSFYIPSAKAANLGGIELSLRDILSRVPRLDELYQMTFGEVANTQPLIFTADSIDDTLFWCRIDDEELFTDRGSLRAIVNRWREKFPFLRAWRLASAAHGWGRSVIKFRNTSNLGIDEFGDERLVNREREFEAVDQIGDGQERFNPRNALDPLAGGLSSSAVIYAISPIDGHFVSEFSLQYLALFLLSSLVRYRPHTWIHAISRSVMPEVPADDQALSLIEHFIESNVNSVPATIVKILNPYQDEFP